MVAQLRTLQGPAPLLMLMTGAAVLARQQDCLGGLPWPGGAGGCNSKRSSDSCMLALARRPLQASSNIDKEFILKDDKVKRNTGEAGLRRRSIACQPQAGFCPPAARPPRPPAGAAHRVLALRTLPASPSCWAKLRVPHGARGVCLLTAAG